MNESFTNLECAIREAVCGFSSARLSQLSGCVRVDPSRPIPGISTGADRWAFRVGVSFEGIALDLHCHYSESTARALAEMTGGRGDSDDVETWHSFIGEYCNLIGGAVENCISGAFRKQGLSAGGQLQLPVKELSGDAGRGVGKPSSAWYLELPSGHELIFLAWIRVSDQDLEEQGVVPGSLALDIEQTFEQHAGMTEGDALDALMQEAIDLL